MPIGGAVSVRDMQALNYAVDAEHKSAHDIVHDFLIHKGIIKNH